MSKKRKFRKAVCLVSVPVLAVAVLLFFYDKIYRVEPAFSEMTYEYGQQVSRNVEDYLSGNSWSVGLGELDLSRVDEAHIGIYEAVARHGDKEFTYSIEIRDTKAPDMILKEGPIYLPLQTECMAEDLLQEVRDHDEHAAVYFEKDGQLLETMSFSQMGACWVTLAARDCSGNESRAEVEVWVDTPPEILGLKKYYLVPGSMPDYLEAVTAHDEVDGDVTASVCVDDSRVDVTKAGEYVLRYEARDGYGLVGSAETRVLVAEAEEIQELIGARRINYRRDVIMGAPNIYDAGAADEFDLEATLEYMRPTMVQLYHATDKGGYSSGSGYIMEITEERIYICTNRHVVSKYDEWDIFFFDGTKVPGKMLGGATGYDVGVAVVDREDVPEELLEQLMTVHIDRTYWSKLDEEPVRLGLERVDREGGLLHVSQGKLLKIKQRFEWNERLDHTEVTLELVHGDSGSAVLDGYGNLICMAYAYSTEEVRYWCVPLDGILKCYEEITGRMPYVY